ncbi:hypothetical protein BGX28_004999 [Mortierella sp. GBA30]|nr:hypothetical protein BGX28_004999 [Mortierella sp. GBA30]
MNMEDVGEESTNLTMGDDTMDLAPCRKLGSSTQRGDDENISEEGSPPPSLCSDDMSDPEDNDRIGEEGGEDENNSEEKTDQSAHANQEKRLYQSSSESNSSTASLQEDPSIIATADAIYSAVPISSELHIIPRSSNGFNWNQDLFLKPHQRRSLGVDELHGSDGAAAGGSSSGDSAIPVHEIQLDGDAEGILPM